MSWKGLGADRPLVRRSWSREWVVTNRVLHGDRTEDGRFLIVCTKETEWGMGGIGAFVRRNRSRGWEVTKRMYGAVGKTL